MTSYRHKLEYQVAIAIYLLYAGPRFSPLDAAEFADTP